jgi:hypothetical protein
MKINKLPTVLFLTSFFLSAYSQSPCSNSKSHEFDFWIGNWTVYQSGSEKVVGYNNIVPVAGGCGIQENWKSADGSNIGTSLNKYTFRKGKWQQFWIDNSGLTLELEGNYADGKMIMTGSILPNDKSQGFINKITWFNNADGTVRQFWEQSQDEGKTWTVAFDGLYKK